jgi:hypothetical protein
MSEKIANIMTLMQQVVSNCSPAVWGEGWSGCRREQILWVWGDKRVDFG